MGLKKKKPFLLTLADLALFLGPILPLIFGLLALAYRVELSQCPTGTFLAGTTKSDLQLIAIVCAVLPFAYCVRHLVVARIPVLANAFRDTSEPLFAVNWPIIALAISLVFGGL